MKSRTAARTLTALLIAVGGWAFLASPASASIDSVFAENPYQSQYSPDGITCEVQGPGDYEGQRWCGSGEPDTKPGSNVETFDGVPIDVNVAFPPAPEGEPDGPYPLMMIFHGFTEGKRDFGYPEMQRWLAKGYAVFTQTDRGFWESCGTESDTHEDPVCRQRGYVRLIDTRYEARDAQEFAGMLADEGLVLPDKIGAVGLSYGGGMSMALAALRNRVMLPDGTLESWLSPDGKTMEIAAAIPDIPWTDLAQSLVPNGRDLDYLEDSPYRGRFGVMKQSLVEFLYELGLQAGGYYLFPGVDPSGDFAAWKNLLDHGEPYEGNPKARAMLSEIKTYHSSYYIDNSISPAPLLVSQGLTDDLFPGKEAIRFFNRTRARHPGAPISVFLSPLSGHPRGQMNKANAQAELTSRQEQWIDHYLKGEGSKPGTGITVYSETCPESADSAGPFQAADWGSVPPGEIRFRRNSQRTVSPEGGNVDVAKTFNSIQSFTFGTCVEAPGGLEQGIASYDLPPATGDGYTVIGAPTVIARISLPGNTSQLAARLVDVSPDGSKKRLINRALWRPDESGFQILQLEANAWKVEPGHFLRLEILPRDSTRSTLDIDDRINNFGRPSNGQETATISNLDLRIPVLEEPGTQEGLITKPAKRVLPAFSGARLAPGFTRFGSVKITNYSSGRASFTVGSRVRQSRFQVNTACGSEFGLCQGRLVVKLKRGSRALTKPRKVSLPGGSARDMTLVTTQYLRQLLRTRRSVEGRVFLGGKSMGSITIKR